MTQAAGGIEASSRRRAGAKQADFVEAMKAGEASLAQAGKPKKLKTLADVCRSDGRGAAEG